MSIAGSKTNPREGKLQVGLAWITASTEQDLFERGPWLRAILPFNPLFHQFVALRIQGHVKKVPQIKH